MTRASNFRRAKKSTSSKVRIDTGSRFPGERVLVLTHAQAQEYYRQLEEMGKEEPRELQRLPSSS